jgi:ribosome-associated toxin RatA of RatAB toxin-antitoxin module
MVMVRVPFTMVAVLVTAAIAFAQTSPTEPEISVTDAAGVFHVTAAFTVAASPGTVTAVLTDYERIPEFMPDVKTSQVRERHDAGLVVEQEAAAKFMMFSRRIHLVLEVSQDGGTIRFRDRCGSSFTKYEGAWRVNGGAGLTRVTYQLSARPSFDVPGFVLKRLFKRDAAAMIDRLTAEITTRGDSGSGDRPK